MDNFTITVPFPPSVNTYWGTRVVGKGKRSFVQRYINEAGKKFRTAVLEQFLVDDIRTTLSGPLAGTLDLYPPCNRRRDWDNFNKGLFDALGHAGLYDDDSQIIDMRVRMHPKKPPGCAIVTLWPVSEIQSQHSQLDLVG